MQLSASYIAQYTDLGQQREPFTATIENDITMAPATSHHLYPPFPDGVVTAPLVSISLAELEADNVAASEALFKASKELGFFYLEMDGSSLGEKMVLLAEQLNALQKKFDDLPFAEKDQFAREKLHPFFGYRHSEIGPIREDGTRDRNELYNVRCSILLAFLENSTDRNSDAQR